MKHCFNKLVLPITISENINLTCKIDKSFTNTPSLVSKIVSISTLITMLCNIVQPKYILVNMNMILPINMRCNAAKVEEENGYLFRYQRVSITVKEESVKQVSLQKNLLKNIPMSNYYTILELSWKLTDCYSKYNTMRKLKQLDNQEKKSTK